MRQIDDERYRKEFSKVRLRFAMSFFGHSEQMRCSITLDEKVRNPDQLSDEQLVIVSRLLVKAHEPLVNEMRRRDLLPSKEQTVTDKKANH